MILNKNKRIGNVIYIVEGVKDEIELLSNIFVKIFDYTTVSYDKRNDYIHLKNNRDKYSKVFLIPAEHSAISRFNPEEEYYEETKDKQNYNIQNNNQSKNRKNLYHYKTDVNNNAKIFLFFIIFLLICVLKF